jgi:hypothetical protein
MQVKGTWITDYAKMIRANKDKDWNQYLTPEDWQIINAKILSSAWYPYETFMRTGNAVFHEIAQQNLAVSRAFGKMFADNIAKVYKNIVIPGDPAASISKIYALQGTFFRDVPSVIAPVLHKKNRTVVQISVTKLEREIGAPEAFAHQFMGMLERMLELVGVKKYSSEIREVETGHELDLRWE